MDFIEGQGVLGKIQFLDGAMPAYDRTYLVVKTTDEYIEVLNVSTTKGKERKLAFPTNRRIKSYNPPFLKPSFVKLDSLTRVEKSLCDSLIILNKGRVLDQNELNVIQQLI